MEAGDRNNLAFGIHRGECILFLGPDLPVQTEDGGRFFPTDMLGERLRRGTSNGDGGTAGRVSHNLASITQHFLSKKREFELEAQVARWHGEIGAYRSKIHENLAAMPFQLIVTSSHDPLMENALRQAGKAPAVERYNFRGARQELLPEPARDAPVLYHLYGHVQESGSLVLSETQLLDFLAALISKNPPLPNDLNAALTQSRLFLFLGFGLDQWYLRILLHVLKVLRRDSLGFAFEALDAPGLQPLDDTVLFYRENYRIDVFNEDVPSFTGELRKTYFEQYPETESATGRRAPAATPEPDGPTVFVSYAREDEARAREVHDALKRSGLRPWLDRESLRGGERWDARIRSTIEEINYFVVLNSQALKTKAASLDDPYVVKEVKAALDKAGTLLRPFIFPARVDAEPLLPQLAPFNAIDLTGEGGLTRLIRDIKRSAQGFGR